MDRQLSLNKEYLKKVQMQITKKKKREEKIKMEKKAVNLGPWATFMFATIMWFFTFMYLGVFQGDNYLMYSVILAVSLLFWTRRPICIMQRVTPMTP